MNSSLFAKHKGHCAAELLREEDMVMSLQAPVKVFGALQGQIWDLLSHFKWFQAPTEEGDLAPLFEDRHGCRSYAHTQVIYDICIIDVYRNCVSTGICDIQIWHTCEIIVGGRYVCTPYELHTYVIDIHNRCVYLIHQRDVDISTSEYQMTSPIDTQTKCMKGPILPAYTCVPWYIDTQYMYNLHGL